MPFWKAASGGPERDCCRENTQARIPLRDMGRDPKGWAFL